MSPLGSRASRAYSPVSMASGFGDRVRSQEPLEEEPAAKISLQVLTPAAPASTAASSSCSASPRWSGVKVAAAMAQPIARGMLA